MTFRLPLFILFLIASDQASKYWIENRFAFQSKYDIAPFFAFYPTHNKGIAFSMFSGADHWLLVGFICLVLALIAYLLWRTDSDRPFTRFGLALIMGGAFGNLLDRLLHGHVIDFVLFYTDHWSFAIFNLADAFITIGAVSVVLDELRKKA